MEGLLEYKINSLSNVSELYVKEFNLTAPADTHKAFTIPGIFSCWSSWMVCISETSATWSSYSLL